MNGRLLLACTAAAGILHQDDVAGGMLKAISQSGAFSLVDGLQDVTDFGPLLRERRHHVFRPVSRLVVDDDDLLVDRNFLDAAQQFGDCGAFVVTGDDHR